MMSNTYFTSLSAMLAASYGLQNTSNNIANMQSPGFKRSDVFYSSLGNGSGEESLGSGVRAGGKSINFNDGTNQPNNNPTNLAIVGQGFFVIKQKNGELFYTRGGDFEFNDNGILIDKHSGGQVQGYDDAGNLVPIHKNGPKTSAGKATHELSINGKFIRHKKTDTEPGSNPVPNPMPDPNPVPDPNKVENKNTYENITFKLYPIYDSQGKEHTLTLEFSSTTPQPESFEGLIWDLETIKYDDTYIDDLSGQKIVFENISSGTTTENRRIQLTLNGNQKISINFGNSNDGDDNAVLLNDAINDSENTQIQIDQNDGYGQGKQIDCSFDDNGQISYLYDNGQAITGIHVGLARFDDSKHLLPSQDNLFRAKHDQGIHFGRANKDGFGAIKAKSLESSNVDSTVEFANIIILQRMFQACSQIMDIDKQLLEELETKS